MGLNKKRKKRSKKRKLSKQDILTGAIIGISAVPLVASIIPLKKTEDIRYIEFVDYISRELVEEVSIGDKNFTVVLKDGTKYNVPNPNMEESNKLIFNSPVEVKYKSEVDFMDIVSTLLTIGLMVMIYKQLSGRGKAFNGGIDTENKKSNIKFDDIAGCEEAKEQLMDISYAIKEPEEYKKFNVRASKGIILYGPAGTGKTKLAKALSNESGASFISVNGANFVDKYVGNGASRVRHLFEEAKKKEPCIIFIDELDAIGSSRDSGGSHDERLQTLNQLLSCMDGFDDNSNITVIAATNRLEVLDKALIRPGRFDSKIYIPLPDLKAREEMFKIFSNGKPVDSSLDFKALAKMTSYFSGADIENVMNLAGVYAIKDKAEVIGLSHISKAINVQIAGEDKKNKKGISPKDKELTAYHEAGHAIVAKLLAKYNVPKISIIPTTRGAGGYTLIDNGEPMYQSRVDLYNQIAIALGGRIAEEIIYGKDLVTTGASSDIKKATSIARGIIESYGMSDRFGMVNLEDMKGLESSIIDETNKIISDIYSSTFDFVKEHKSLLEKVKEVLVDNEILHEDEFQIVIDEIVSKTNSCT